MRSRPTSLYDAPPFAACIWMFQAWREHGFDLRTAWRLAQVRWRLQARRLPDQARTEAELAPPAGEYGA